MPSDKVMKLQNNEAQGFQIGNVEDQEAGTGVTVIWFPEGAQVGVDISGGGPASRETPLTSPVTAANPINAIVLSGGSAYGLAAAGGVMRCLEDHGIGFPAASSLVPLVCQSCIFDLEYKNGKVRPDEDMGYRAAEKALAGNDPRQGSVGGGCGATVGKIFGMERAVKTGLGIASVQCGKIQMTAVVVVNALGDIVDSTNGKTIAGPKNPDGSFADTREALLELMAPTNLFTSNTTIGCVITNAAFSKAELTKLASMTRNAYARAIRPVGTLADGDTIYAASVGQETADLNMAGVLSAMVMEEAIRNAVYYADRT